MKEPFSQEETCSSRFIDFAERSILNRIVPAHDIGFMAKGTLAEKIFEWELGIFNGGSRNAAGRNANDVNDEKDIALRVRATPFKTSDNDWIKNLRIGLAYGIGDVDTTAIADVTTGDLGGLTVLDFNGTEDGLRTRLGVELSWLMGPASVRAEYMTVNQEIITATGTGDFDITGYYFQVTYLLTGETKPLENHVKPTKPFSIKDGGMGAWELAFRIANLDASDGDVDAIPSANNQKVDEITVGVNWWLTQNFRVMLNYERFEFDEDIPQAGSSPIGDQSLFYTRIQIDF
jgi:phosphate-selective porin OprO/OprP